MRRPRSSQQVFYDLFADMSVDEQDAALKLLGELHPCTNPAHLFVGTRVENMKDMCAKGRHFRSIGELSASAKLTEAQVLEIRRRYAAGGVTQLVLAREFEVGETAIKEINRRETWSHI